MVDRPAWDDQFREEPDETRERWRRIKAERTSAGKCWQCARLIIACDCCNIVHPERIPAAGRIKQI
jgi:hypothetical protein